MNMNLNRRGLFGFIAGVLAFAAAPVAAASTQNFGAKALPPKRTQLQDINTHRVLREIKRLLENASSYALFEPNDAFTRHQLNDILSKQLEYMKTRNAIVDYKVVVDETNNTPEVIENNELVMDVYVKPPSHTISYHQINCRVTRDSIEISSNN